MYYRLGSRYVLRGWELLPFAVCDTVSGQTAFFKRDDFRLVLRCDGWTEIQEEKLGGEQKRLLDLMLDQKIIEPCGRGEGLQEVQTYRRYPSRFIKTVQWSITGRCNFRCRHCFMSAPEAKYGELPLAECLKIVDEMAACGIMSVSLTGGEPLVRKDFFRIVDALLEKGIRVNGIYSNGKLVNDRLLDEFDARGLRPVIHMSFDGTGWHDWLRGIAGAEKYVMDAYRLCQERGFETTAEMCIHKKNQDTIRETAKLLRSMGVRSLKVNPAIPMGEWLKESTQYTLTAQEAYQVYLDYIPHYFEDHMPISIALEGFFTCDEGNPDYHIPNIKYEDECDCLTKSICGHARNSLYISPEGTALPCMPLAASCVKEQFPNILEESLAGILSDSFYMRMVDVRLGEYLEHNPQCRECPHRNACGGGCRGFAIGQDGDDYLAADLQACAFFKGGYPEKIRKTADEAKKRWL